MYNREEEDRQRRELIEIKKIKLGQQEAPTPHPVGKVAPQHKLRHFWDYYKYWVLGGILAVIMVWYFFVTVVFQERPDVEILYASVGIVSEEKIQQLSDYLKEYAEDYNEDGKVIVKIKPVLFAGNQTLGASGEVLSIGNTGSAQYNYQMMQKLLGELSTKDSPLMLLDDTVYNTLTMQNENGQFYDLSTLVSSDVLAGADRALFSAIKNPGELETGSYGSGLAFSLRHPLSGDSKRDTLRHQRGTELLKKLYE